MNITDFEIMAPVGSYESLTAAIQGGANSVYFGIEGLNMRARSSNNFTIHDLHEIARICRENNMKSYLTVNTVIYDEDLTLMRSIIDAAKEAEISAIIASDVAAMTYARSIGVEVHLSTQLNISNAEALKFYAQFADVVVLARELNMNQVSHIYQRICDEQMSGRKTYPHRNVRTRSSLYGRIGKMLLEPARNECLCQSGSMYANMPEGIYGKR